MQAKYKTLQAFRFVLSLLLIPQEAPLHATPTLKELTLYTASAAAATYIGYLACSKPATCIPTFDSLQALSAIPIEQQSTSEIPIITIVDPVHSAPPSPRASTVAKGLIGIVEPTKPFILSVNNMQHMVTSGAAATTLRCDEPLWINICGWDPCSGRDTARGINENIRLTKRGLGNHIVHGPALFIALNDKRRVFNFGQDTDQKNIDFAYHQAEDKDIIWNARCKGASALLGWMQHYPSNARVRAIILESPTISLHYTCQDVSIRLTHSKIIGALIHRLFTFYYPNYSAEKAKEQEEIAPLQLDPNVPIFIGNIKKDPISSDTTITNLVKQLRKKSQNPIYYYVCQEPITHAYLNTSKEYQRVINAFLKQYNLPHNEELAQQGQELLELAQLRAENLKSE
ncbi:hypothetical protein CVU75_00705 [Candidatus Dependentiae bacterium HGW-Dependentiae-1]|nr:MAG: hypothetical protein CVU75_00705 [Candidatus Dependentiae bacterium HGW-Dependentiae-1]